MDNRIPLLKESLIFLARKYPHQLLEDFKNGRHFIKEYTISGELEAQLAAIAKSRIKEIEVWKADQKLRPSIAFGKTGNRIQEVDMLAETLPA